jgi:heat-inducible transcriptional repressor
MDLEQEGFLTRPHPSAGSVPLDKGYRLYVESITADGGRSLPAEVRESIKRRLIEVERDIEEWSRVAAAILAGLVGNMAVATSPKARESRVKHIQLVRLQDILTLLIVVFEQARIRRQLIKLEEPAEPDDLQSSASKLNTMLQGLTWRQIEAKEMELSSLEEEVVGSAVGMLKDEDRSQHRDHYLDGLRNLLAQPEFTGNHTSGAYVEGVEDGSLVQAVLDQAPEVGTVRVIIGRENRDDVLQPLSVVIGQYGVPGGASGVVGAIGPVRMEYTTAISGVELMAGLMAGLVEGVV